MALKIVPAGEEKNESICFLIKYPSSNSINNIGICKNSDDNIEVSMTTIFEKFSDLNFSSRKSPVWRGNGKNFTKFTILHISLNFQMQI